MIFRSGVFSSFRAAYKRSRLSGARRPGDQDDPVRPPDQIVERLVVVLRESELLNPTLMLSLSRIRITTDWPWAVGITLTRRSSSFRRWSP